MLHVHNLNHKEVDRHLCLLVIDAQNRVNAHVAQVIGKLLVQLGAKRSARDAIQCLPAEMRSNKFHSIDSNFKQRLHRLHATTAQI